MRITTRRQQPPYLQLATSDIWCWSRGRKTVSVLQYRVLLYLCTKVQAVLTGRLTVSGFDLAWFICLSLFFMVRYIKKKFCLHPSLYLLVSWPWWDWPLTWLTLGTHSCLPTEGWPRLCRPGCLVLRWDGLLVPRRLSTQALTDRDQRITTKPNQQLCSYE